MTQHAEFRRYLESGLLPGLSIYALREERVTVDYLEGSSGPGLDAPRLTTDTRFNIGSVTKPITASLIVKLVERGEISLEDAVVRYIPEYPFAHVTLLHLMTHTTGYWGTPSIPWPTDKSDLTRYFAQIYGISELVHETGSNGTYFSQGFSILMDLLQRITGATIEEFAREVLFDPLGMRHTTYDVTALAPHEFVLPFSADTGNSHEELRTAPATGDSGLFSTAADLVKFGKLILDKGATPERTIFSRASIALMLREVTDGRFQRTPVFWKKGPSNWHGCFGDLCSEAAVGHPGFSGCMLMIDPVFKTTVAIVSNATALHANWGNYRRILNSVLSAQ